MISLHELQVAPLDVGTKMMLEGAVGLIALVALSGSGLVGYRCKYALYSILLISVCFGAFGGSIFNIKLFVH